MKPTAPDMFKTKVINIPIIAIYDEETDEPICARWFGSENYTVCKFFLTRRCGTQDVCGFGENKDLHEKTSRGFRKPHDKCVIHHGQNILTA